MMASGAEHPLDCAEIPGRVLSDWPEKKNFVIDGEEIFFLCPEGPAGTESYLRWGGMDMGLERGSWSSVLKLYYQRNRAALEARCSCAYNACENSTGSSFSSFDSLNRRGPLEKGSGSGPFGIGQSKHGSYAGAVPLHEQEIVAILMESVIPSFESGKGFEHRDMQGMRGRGSDAVRAAVKRSADGCEGISARRPAGGLCYGGGDEDSSLSLYESIMRIGPPDQGVLFLGGRAFSLVPDILDENYYASLHYRLKGISPAADIGVIEASLQRSVEKSIREVSFRKSWHDYSHICRSGSYYDSDKGVGFFRSGGEFIAYALVPRYSLYEPNNNLLYAFEETRVAVELYWDDFWRWKNPKVLDRYSHPFLPEMDKEKQEICVGPLYSILDRFRQELSEDHRCLGSQVSFLLEYSKNLLMKGYRPDKGEMHPWNWLHSAFSNTMDYDQVLVYPTTNSERLFFKDNGIYSGSLAGSEGGGRR